MKYITHEYYTLALLSIGLPVVAWTYLDWRAALFTFVVVQSTIGILAIRNANDRT